MRRIEALDRYSRDVYENAGTGADYNRKVLYPFGVLISENSRSSRVLDLACGKGDAADYMEDALGLKVVRSDLSLDGLSLGRKSRVRALADRLPFRDGMFDGVHMKDALIHMPDVDKLIGELSRVLKPKGKALITSAYPSRFSNFFYQEDGEKRSNSAYIYSPVDYERQVMQLIKKPNVSEISPPYYSNNPQVVEDSAKAHGFSLLSIGEWTPEESSDWYRESPKPVNRFVMLFEKL